jgi:archaeal cell division control protein 6
MSCPEGSRILLDDAALSEEYLPSRLPARDDCCKVVEDSLAMIRQGRRPVHLWLYGNPGSGKTTVAKSILQKIESQGGLHYAVVNCWERDSFYEILDQLITELKVFCAEEHRTSLKLERLSRHLNGKPFVLLLDEIDKLSVAERARTLYALDGLGSITLICISLNLSTMHELDDRVKSRLNARCVEFVPYSPRELYEVLSYRASLCLASGSYSPKDILHISSLSDGDARVGLRTLRSTALAAERNHHEVIIDVDVVNGWHASQKPTATVLLSQQTEDHRILFDILSRNREMTSTKLWNTYRRHCAKVGRHPVANRTFSGYITRLVRLGLADCQRARERSNIRLLKLCNTPSDKYGIGAYPDCIERKTLSPENPLLSH